MEQAETPTRELTLEEAIELAVLLQQQDELVAAGALFRRVLEVAPDHPRALHYAGVLAHQQGRGDEAVALIQKSLSLDPGCADGYNNLGIVFQSAGRLAESIDACRRAIGIDANHANAHSNLGVLLRATGRPAEAEASYRTAIQLNPEHIDAYTNLGILLNGLRRTEEAAACFCRVITLRPKHREARKLLALAHCTLGEVNEAAQIFEEWLDEEPEDPIARHMCAACTGEDVPVRASNAFVERTFDSFASSFEAKLEKLSYRAPALIIGMLEGSGLAPSNTLETLDAGCGTGLCGPLVAPYARRLVGVDLSEGMLTLARQKKIYDTLIRMDLAEFLRQQTDVFDLIVSADTLVYFGDLEDVVESAAAALRPGGILIFTLEEAFEEQLELGYRLEFHGRYTHTRAYAERILGSAGLQPDIARAELRTESGAPVAGLVVRATKVTAGRGTV